jgi:hypothetical protein
LEPKSRILGSEGLFLSFRLLKVNIFFIYTKFLILLNLKNKIKIEIEIQNREYGKIMTQIKTGTRTNQLKRSIIMHNETGKKKDWSRIWQTMVKDYLTSNKWTASNIKCWHS